jgi:hypothetical protein
MRLQFTQLCILTAAGLGGREVYGKGLLPIACWGCGFESSRGHECLSVVSVVCYQAEVSRPDESYGLWCVLLCDLETSRMRRSRLALGCRARTKQKSDA